MRPCRGSSRTLRAAVRAARAFAALVVASVVLVAGAAVRAHATTCLWRESVVGAVADSCLLNTDPFSNYGLLDRL